MRSPLAITTFGLVLLACSDPLGPDRGDPAQYTFSETLAYHCQQWIPQAPAVQLGLFDIHWHYGGESGLSTGPKSKDVQAVVRAGGTIVHQFNISMVRAIVSPGAIPSLGAEIVRAVTDANIYKVTILVTFRSGNDEDDVIVSLGGTVTQRFVGGGLLEALVPDANVPAIRQDPRVVFVQSEAVTGCIEQ